MSLTDEDKRWITGLLDERLERVETNLLTAFHKWASPMEARQRTHAAALRALDLELETLDDRVKKLERVPSSQIDDLDYRASFFLSVFSAE
jgi:hypothetical protein